MRKKLIIGVALAGMMGVMPGRTEAQSLEDLLNSDAVKKAVSAVKDLNAFSWEDLQGTWSYKGAACRFVSDDLLAQAGGAVMASQLTKKMDETYTKIGIVPGKFTYIFNRDSTFTTQIGRKKLSGSYSYDASTGKLTLRYFSLIPSEAQVVKSGDKIDLLFHTDRLLKLLTTLSGYTKNDKIAALGKIAEQYDGMQLGFEMSK